MMLARQIEFAEMRRAAEKAAEQHRKRFRRRWQCRMFLYDREKLRLFCQRYDVPFFSRVGSPHLWGDRLRDLARTRRYILSGDDAVRTTRPHQLYHQLSRVFKQHQGYT